MPQPNFALLRDQVLQAIDHTTPSAAALAEAAAHFLERARQLQEGEEAEASELLGRLAPAALSDLVRRRREACGLSLATLGKRAGLALGTVRNVEKGRTAATPLTLRRLARVPELALVPAGAPMGLRPNAWLPENYDPRALVEEMRQILNGRGGRLEQTCLYLDHASAADYLAVTTAPAFVERFRSLPAAQIAGQVVAQLGDAALEIVALGPGDGRSEVMLCGELLAAKPGLELQLLLLDISHTLLTLAQKRARAELPEAVRVEALHGDFREIARYPVLNRSATPRRRRCYTMLGCTLANVDNEVLFIRDGLAQAAPGDLAVVDFQLAWTDERDPDRIRAADPAFRAPPAAGHARWFAGPLHRYAADVERAELGMELLIDCPVDGSYELDFYADVTRRGELQRFHLFRVRRYNAELLLATFARHGWERLACQPYGPAGKSAVALLRRR